MPAVDVLDSRMAYVEQGRGTSVVFLHGNPTSSYLWRRVVPQIRESGRCLAPDLIGMGDSGKPPVAYRFTDHARYLDAWFDALNLDAVVLVGHDWGGALAFDWATRHRSRVRGVAQAMALDQNGFIEQALPRTIARDVADEDIDAYRKPYPTRDTRLPLLQ